MVHTLKNLLSYECWMEEDKGRQILVNGFGWFIGGGRNGIMEVNSSSWSLDFNLGHLQLGSGWGQREPLTLGTSRRGVLLIAFPSAVTSSIQVDRSQEPTAPPLHRSRSTAVYCCIFGLFFPYSLCRLRKSNKSQTRTCFRKGTIS